MRTVTINIDGEPWDVPFGFGREYKRTAALEQAAPGIQVSGLGDLLGLIGYMAPEHEIAGWPLRKRVEASVYAANVHGRASDNILLKHPRPDWFPERAWDGAPEGDGIFAGPGPTPIPLPRGSVLKGHCTFCDVGDPRPTCPRSPQAKDLKP